MKNKINIAKLLKDCPKGMELDCTMYEDVTLIHVLEGCTYPIKLETPDGQLSLNKCGQYSNNKFAKCVIFPKGKTTWEGFQRPFKDGDILTVENESNPFIFYCDCDGFYNVHCALLDDDFISFTTPNKWTSNHRKHRFATEEEKQKLFDAIKANGYHWNEETKSLKKLVKPKFKVGDRITYKVNKTSPFTITEITDTSYKGGYRYEVLIEQQDNFELVPNKFDINTLKPFNNCKYSLDGGITWKYAQYWFIQEKYNTNDIDIELWQG